MTFDRIGPYDLSRADSVAAAIIVSFVTSPWSVRLVASVYVLLGLAMVVAGIVFGVPLLAGLGVYLVVWIYIIVPALRSRKTRKDIYLDYSPDGIVMDTARVKITYKWSTIGKARRVGTRLFIMITDRLALVVPDHATSPVNMDRLVATCSFQATAASR